MLWWGMFNPDPAKFSLLIWSLLQRPNNKNIRPWIEGRVCYIYHSGFMQYLVHEFSQLYIMTYNEKCKVNDVIFPSGCEAHAINLGNKNTKIGILAGDTSVRSKNIFTDISRHPTEKHEIKKDNPLAHTKQNNKYSINITTRHIRRISR